MHKETLASWAGGVLATAILSSAAIADDRVQAVSSADGRLEVFVRSGSDDRIYHVWQIKPGSGSAATLWHWEKADTQLRGSDFAAGRDSAGRLFVAAAKDGVIHFNAQPSAGTSFGNAWSLDTHDVHGLALAADADKRIDLLTISELGAAWSTAETQAGNRTFANHPIGGTKLRSIAPTPFMDGRLALVAVGGDRTVWWTSQTAPNANWGGWRSLAGHDIQVVVAGPDADGRLDVMALGADNALYHRYELAGGGWSEWETESTGPLFVPMNMVSNADGRLEVFAHNAMGQIVHAWQVAPNGSWTPFTVLDVIRSNTRSNSLTMMPDGRLVIVAVGDGDEYPTINVAGQRQANGDWEAWLRPPTAEPAPAPKPKVTFDAKPNNCYGPVGFTCSFTWSVANCGSDCTVSMVGKTGLGNYDTVFLPPTAHRIRRM